MYKYFKEILYLLGPDQRKLPMLIMLFLGSSILDLLGIALLGPYVALVINPNLMEGKLGQFVDWVGLPQEHLPLLTILGLVLFCIFMIKAISSIAIQFLIIRFSNRQQVRLQSFLMQSYQSMPYSLYLQRNSSDYIYSINSLTGQYASNVVLNLLNTASNVIIGTIILALLAWENIIALATLFGLLGLVVLCHYGFFKGKLKIYGEKINTASTAMLAGIQEGIDGFKEIRVLGKEGYFKNKVREGAIQSVKYQLRNQIITLLPSHIIEVVLFAFIVLMVLSTMFFGENLQNLIPTLSMFGVAALRLKPAALTIANCLTQLSFSRDAVSRLLRDFEYLKELQLESMTEAEGTIIDQNKENLTERPKERFESLVVRNLSFRYPKALGHAFSNISLEILPGESIGFIGPSGAGKTSLVDVLLGLLDPQAGEILYNGQPLKDILTDWRAQVAYLPQQVFLIDDTLLRNVALGVEDADIDDLRLHEALRQARLSELVDQLPLGIDTLLGERGARISGGQRQRVALARAFYHQRNVLVLDEATSSLDNETEGEIVDEIKNLKGRITMIVIAHRLTTIEHCDRIYSLENGMLTNSGTPDQMLNLKKIVNM